MKELIPRERFIFLFVYENYKVKLASTARTSPTTEVIVIINKWHTELMLTSVNFTIDTHIYTYILLNHWLELTKLRAASPRYCNYPPQ